MAKDEAENLNLTPEGAAEGAMGGASAESAGAPVEGEVVNGVEQRG